MRIRLNLAGLILLSVGIFLTASLVTGYLCLRRTPAKSRVLPSAGSVQNDQPANQPWGKLVTQDILLEKPDEYMASVAEANLQRPPAWNFGKLLREQVRSLLTECGLTSTQIDEALASELPASADGKMTIHPRPELTLALTPATRARLYQKLASLGDNFYMEYPVYYTEESLAVLATDKLLYPETLTLLKKLLYKREKTLCFSDVETALRLIPSPDERSRFMRTLSQQPAVLARLHIDSSTDLDKLIAYWSTVPAAKVKDLRPVLEAIKATPGGGNLSLLYLLPPFARQRLYTSPLPAQAAGYQRMDCHWSTVNFFNESAEQTINDSAIFTGQYLTSHFDKVQKPERYGDIVIVVGSKNQTLHSAVYVADDIFFTKNGDNHMQPWTLMRMKDILNLYRQDPAKNIMTFRRKDI